MKTNRRSFLFGALAAPFVGKAAKAATEMADVGRYHSYKETDPIPDTYERYPGLQSSYQRYTGYQSLDLTPEELGINTDPCPYWRNEG